MKILVVGSGGRESAIVWKLRSSEKVSEIYCAPGNGSIGESINISATDISGLLEFVLSEKIDLTVVGTEEPLAMGIVDAFNEKGLKIFGPDKKAAIIEYSKEFSKDFMVRNSIPTAKHESFDDKDGALRYIEKNGLPTVIKADGLSVGKGVYICNTYEEADEALTEIMVQEKFGKAGKKVVVEEFLEGTEVSILSFVDGKTIVPMISSKDHKHAYDGNQGPNTGGMGTVAPNSAYNEKIAERCMEEIFKPTVRTLAKEGRAFKGIIFFGLMLTKDGPKLLEYNARFGDPETQVVLPLLENDLLDILLACCDGTLEKIDIRWKKKAAVCVVLASLGYPGKYETGFEIKGLENLAKEDESIVFGAGVKLANGKLLTSGGRVLGVSAKAKSLPEAIDKAYKETGKISFENMHMRSDIGRKWI